MKILMVSISLVGKEDPFKIALAKDPADMSPK
jgi:hypothetical protein